MDLSSKVKSVLNMFINNWKKIVRKEEDIDLTSKEDVRLILTVYTFVFPPIFLFFYYFVK